MFEFLKKIFNFPRKPDGGSYEEQKHTPVVSYNSEIHEQNQPSIQAISPIQANQTPTTPVYQNQPSQRISQPVSKNNTQSVSGTYQNRNSVQNSSTVSNSYYRNDADKITSVPGWLDETDNVQRCDVMDDLAAERESLRQFHEMNVEWKKELEESENKKSTGETKKRNLLDDYFKADLEGVILTDEFLRTFDLMENTSDNVIITGKAGTGKSTLLKYFLVHTQKTAVALAPTGIAAINIGGDTIHSFFHFPWELLTKKNTKNKKDDLYKNIDTLIIDEFSMVNANLLGAVEEVMRQNGKKSLAPFGGVQVIFFGDFFQLPPVVRDLAVKEFFVNKHGSPWFFSSTVFKRADFTYRFIELQENHRQNEQQFMELLDNMRLGTQTQEQLELLNSRFEADNHDISAYPIMLVPSNEQADNYNKEKLQEIDSKEYVLSGRIDGDFPKEKFPTLPLLHLKVGAQVMTIVNNRAEGYVNGSIGKVISINDDVIQIEVDSREGSLICNVYRHTWENFISRYIKEEQRVEREKIGSFTQFPLRLAWAITVHKSQGLTFDAVTLDIGGGGFAPGLAYVAVSRCRSLEGLRLLSRIQPTDIKVDPYAREFYLSNIHSGFR